MKMKPKNGFAILLGTAEDGIETQLKMPLKELEVSPFEFHRVAGLCHPYEPEWEIIRKAELRIWTPDGIGDLSWVFTKLQTLRDMCGAERVTLCKQQIPKPLDYFRKSDRAKDFVAMNPTVTRLEDAAERIVLPDCGYLIGELGYDYLLDPTRVLEAGKPFSEWLPRVAPNFDYQMKTPEPYLEARPVVYVGDRYAEVFWGSTWSDDHWADVILWLRERYGVDPYVVGMEHDVEKVKGVANAISARGVAGGFVNLIGTTSVEEVFGLIFQSPVFVGAISGLTIYAAVRGHPTLALWPDTTSLHDLPKTMWGGWLHERYVGSSYVPVGYSTPLADVLLKLGGLAN